MEHKILRMKELIKTLNEAGKAYYQEMCIRDRLMG